MGTKESAVWRGYFCIYIRSCDLPVLGEYLLWWPGYLVLSREGWPPVTCPNWENSIFHLFIYILPPGFLSFSDSVCLIVLLPLCLADWSPASPCHLRFFLFSSLNFSSYLLSLPGSSAYTGTRIRVEPNTTGSGQWNNPQRYIAILIYSCLVQMSSEEYHPATMLADEKNPRWTLGKPGEPLRRGVDLGEKGEAKKVWGSGGGKKTAARM